MGALVLAVAEKKTQITLKNLEVILKRNMAQTTKSQVTLKGSAQMVSEFFNYDINSILYQRGIYPPESFTRKQEYGLTILVSTDEKVKAFLDNVLSQIKDWLEERKVRKLVMVLASVETKETLECWEFNVEYEADGDDKENLSSNKNYRDKTDKDEKKIKQEIREVIRQITASVTFLPLLDCICSFDVLIHTHKDLEAPIEWGESEACLIKNPEHVQLRSFSTNIHKVDTAVCYKADL